MLRVQLDYYEKRGQLIEPVDIFRLFYLLIVRIMFYMLTYFIITCTIIINGDTCRVTITAKKRSYNQLDSDDELLCRCIFQTAIV